jgi:DNA-binding Xre family transcriptional regulator
VTGAKTPAVLRYLRGRIMRSYPHAQSVPSDLSVAAKFLVRAADRLDLSNKEVARIIGVSEATISGMRKGDCALDGKPLELAIMLIRLCRSLDVVVGGDDLVAKAWLRNQNSILSEAPLELIQTVSGLADVLQYLDARRTVV